MLVPKLPLLSAHLAFNAKANKLVGIQDLKFEVQVKYVIINETFNTLITFVSLCFYICPCKSQWDFICRHQLQGLQREAATRSVRRKSPTPPLPLPMWMGWVNLLKISTWRHVITLSLDFICVYTVFPWIMVTKCKKNQIGQIWMLCQRLNQLQRVTFYFSIHNR